MNISPSSRLRSLSELSEWNPTSIDQHLGLPSGSFQQWSDRPDILYMPRRVRSADPAVSALRGTFLFAKGRKIVRGYPKIYYGSMHQTLLAALRAERDLLSLLKDQEIIFERKVDGVNIRLYMWDDKLYCATRYRFDGSSPGRWKVHFGELALRVIEERYPKARDLAGEAYTLVFELTSPALENPHFDYTEDDLTLIDVITPCQTFLSRSEKEALAENHNLNLVEIYPKETLSRAMSQDDFHKHYRTLEFFASRLEIEGFVAKAYVEGEPVYLKIKAPEIRQYHQGLGMVERSLNRLVETILSECDQEELANKDYLYQLVESELVEDYGLKIDGDLKKLICQAVEKCLEGYR